MQFDLRTMAEHMGGVAWGVVIVLAIMSIYSIGVMIERYYTYSQATKQSRKYAPEVARFLKQGKIKEAIDASHGPTVASMIWELEERLMHVCAGRPCEQPYSSVRL